jgi:MFS family permease
MESLRRLSVAVYAVAAVFLLSPLIDVVTNTYPTDLGSMQWRFGAIGILSNYIISAVFGLLLATLVAAVLGHRLVLRVSAVVNVVTAVVLFLITLLFGLDVLQLRQAVRPEAGEMFRIGALKASFKIATTAVALLLLGIGAFRAARGDAPEARKGRKDAPLLVREG